MKLTLAVTGALLGFCGLLAAQTVHVVDASGGPGSSFTAINDAVAAAIDGDVVLVRSGTYSEIVRVEGKSLTLQGDPGSGTTPEIGGIRILGISGALTMRGFEILLPDESNPPDHLVDLSASPGSVWLEEIQTAFFSHVLESVVRIDTCASVVLSRCHFDWSFLDGVGQAQVDILRSSVQLFDSRSDPCRGADTIGFPGIRSEGPGVLGIYESLVQGGLGGTDPGTICYIPYDGGPGILLVGEVELVSHEADIQGGPPTTGGIQCSEASVGPPLLPVDAPVTMLTSTARTHRVASPVRDDESVMVDLEGEPGDLVRVFFSLQPSAPLFLGPVDGPVLLAAPRSKVTLGSLPGSGMQSLNVPIGDLGPGVAYVAVTAQALFLNSSELVLSEPTTLLLLDQSF